MNENKIPRNIQLNGEKWSILDFLTKEEISEEIVRIYHDFLVEAHEVLFTQDKEYRELFEKEETPEHMIKTLKSFLCKYYNEIADEKYKTICLSRRK